MIELYQKENCPFCKKVRDVLNDLNLDFICRISKDGTPQREMMLKLGGQPMVPFLVDQSNGVMMYESGDIVEYLQTTYGKSSQSGKQCCGGNCMCKNGSATATDAPKVCPVE